MSYKAKKRKEKMNMKVCAIASGSSGNCTFISNKKIKILIDVGISLKNIVNNLKCNDIDIKDIDAIFITHEHIDHIKSVGVISRNYDIPIYANENTWNSIKTKKSMGAINEKNIKILQTNNVLSLGHLSIKSFNISHDASEPVGYIIYDENKKVCIATDIGEINDELIKNLKYSNIIVLESNHDVNMVQISKYPYSLKRRILGDKGHLCNELAGQLLAQVNHRDLKYAILGHLSKENNFEELAYQAVKNELDSHGIEYFFELEVARRDQCSRMYCV